MDDHAKYTEGELLDGLRRAAREVGEPLTVAGYDAYRAAHPELASGIWVIRALGTWVTACERAGVRANATRSTSRRWTEEQVVGHVADYLAEPGSTGSFSGYAAWAKGVDGAPSGAAVRNYFSWSQVCERAREAGR